MLTSLFAARAIPEGTYSLTWVPNHGHRLPQDPQAEAIRSYFGITYRLWSVYLQILPYEISDLIWPGYQRE